MPGILEKIREYSKALIDRYLDCIQKEAIVKQFLFSQKNTNLKEDAWKLPYIYIRISLFNDFVSSLSNLVTDKDKRVASHANILRLISCDEAKCELEAFYNRVDTEPPVLLGDLDPLLAERLRMEMEEERRKERINNFNMLYPKVISDGKELLSSKLARNLYRFRCKVIAHYEMKQDGVVRRLFKPDDLKLKWGEPFAFFDTAGARILDLYRLINDSSYIVDRYREQSEKYAKCFHDALF